MLDWAGTLLVGVAQLVELRVVVPAAAGSSPVAHPSEAPAKRAFLRFGHVASNADGVQTGSNFLVRRPRGRMGKKRAYGTGAVYIKYGNYYGRWRTPEGGRVNRKLGPVRRPGTRSGLTHSQAEKRMRELMAATTVVVDRV